jgi:hypothetical protein
MRMVDTAHYSGRDSLACGQRRKHGRVDRALIEQQPIALRASVATFPSIFDNAQGTSLYILESHLLASATRF